MPRKKTIAKTSASEEIIAARLEMIFKMIAMLKAGRWTIKQLVDVLDLSKSSLYRAVKLLDRVGFEIDKDSHNRYFIASAEDDPINAKFSADEISVVTELINRLIVGPLKDSILKKFSYHSEHNGIPRLFLKAHLSFMVEQLNRAIRDKIQVVLKKYSSPNSNTVRDRIVEPIAFGDNYNTIIAYDTEDGVCKQFKLDRIGEIVETRRKMKFEARHEKRQVDIFGITGNASMRIQLKMDLLAYRLMGEEYPLAISYMAKEGDHYVFDGPVADFKGIGRFVLGLMDAIEIVGPHEFQEYISMKMTDNFARLQARMNVAVDQVISADQS